MFAENHTLDKFYVNFENNFRGSTDDIEKKTIFYAELLKRSSVDFSSYPIVDAGCGRGELLSIFKRYSLPAIGVDINYAMVEEANNAGLHAVQGDAVKYIEKQSQNSVGAVTGMQLIEHIPFETLVTFFDACYKALVVNGCVAFETPNPENLNVGTYSFHMDPSHLKPLPPPLVKYALESVGFADVEIVYLNEAKKKRKSYKDPMLQELSNRLYGALDYAVIAYKR